MFSIRHNIWRNLIECSNVKYLNMKIICVDNQKSKSEPSSLILLSLVTQCTVSRSNPCICAKRVYLHWRWFQRGPSFVNNPIISVNGLMEGSLSNSHNFCSIMVHRKSAFVLLHAGNWVFVYGDKLLDPLGEREKPISTSRFSLAI